MEIERWTCHEVNASMRVFRIFFHNAYVDALFKRSDVCFYVAPRNTTSLTLK